MVTEKSKETLKRLDNGSYQNTRVVNLGDVPFSARDILVKAPLVSRLNCYYVGGTGMGKTQLAHDLMGYLSDSSCYALGRPDFEPSELMKTIDFDILRRLQSGEKVPKGELEKLTDNVSKCFFYVDELNRCPPIVQNYFFDFFDGKLVHKGRIINLGREGYSIGFASGNLGNGQYTGTSDSDRALKDRMHMILGIDSNLFAPTPYDIFRIQKKEVRASMPEEKAGFTSDIINMNREFLERSNPLLFPLLRVYFVHGLNYLENVRGHSKRDIPAWFHANVEGLRQDTDEGLIYPLSIRAALSAEALASALQFIAEAKDIEVQNPVKLYLDSLKLTVPFSGVLHPIFVDQKHNGDVYSAFEEAITFSRELILRKQSKLEEAVVLAEAGVIDTALLKDIAPEEGRFNSIKEAIESHANERKNSLTEEGLKLKDIIKQVQEA